MTVPSEAVCEHTAKQFEEQMTFLPVRGWPGRLRRLDAVDSSYRT